MKLKLNKSKILYLIFSVIVFGMFLLKISNTNGYSDVYIQEFLLLILLCAGGILYFNKKVSKKTKIGIFLLGLAVFVSYPLYNDYLVYSHDINFHLVRIEGLKEALSNFQIPARIHPLENNGYGYATSMVYPELFLYIPAILRILNTSMVFSYKILLFLINVVAIFCMYLSVKNISKSTTAGIISAIIFSAANYRLGNIFTRAAVGEALALSFFPLAIWGLYEVCLGNRKKWYILVIGISCIIQSHILSLLFLAITCIVIGIAFIKNIIKEKRYKEIAISLITILLINFWFILPFIDIYKLDLNVKNVSENSTVYVFHKYTVIPAQLFNIFDTAYSLNLAKDNELDMENEMSYTLGILVTAGVIISAIYFVKNRNKNNDYLKFIKVLIGIGIVFLILSTNLVPWEELENKFSIIKKICLTMQFGWRFLGITTVNIAIATGIILGKYVDERYDENKDFIANYKIVIIMCAIAFVAVPLFLGEYSKQFKFITNEYKLNYDLSGQGEYFIYGTDTSALKEDKYLTSDNQIIINNYEKNDDEITLTYKNKIGKGYIEVPLLYYPGYVAKDENGKKLNVVCGDNNVLRVELENECNNGKITIEYKEKTLYVIADIISLVSIIGFIWVIRTLKKEK